MKEFYLPPFCEKLSPEERKKVFEFIYGKYKTSTQKFVAVALATAYKHKKEHRDYLKETIDLKDIQYLFKLKDNEILDFINQLSGITKVSYGFPIMKKGYAMLNCHMFNYTDVIVNKEDLTKGTFTYEIDEGFIKLLNFLIQKLLHPSDVTNPINISALDESLI